MRLVPIAIIIAELLLARIITHSGVILRHPIFDSTSRLAAQSSKPDAIGTDKRAGGLIRAARSFANSTR